MTITHRSAGEAPEKNFRNCYVVQLKRDADTVVVSWTNGMHGPVFLMGVRGDTLRGRVRFTTDIVGEEPPPEDAWAVRIACR